jgi:hypothetical protein
MKILIFGNSQIGAFKCGYDELEGGISKSIEFTFFGVAEQGLAQFSLKSDQLVFPSRLRSAIFSNLGEIETSIDLSIYDLIIVVAGLSPLSPRLLYTRNLNSLRLHSRSVLESSISAPPRDWVPILRTSQICFDIMKMYGKKVAYIGNPLSGPQEPLAKFINSAPDEFQDVVRSNSRCIRKLATETSLFGSSKVLLPPESSLGINQISLKSCYYKDGLRLDGSINGDYWHANSSYGALMLNQIIDGI